MKQFIFLFLVVCLADPAFAGGPFVIDVVGKKGVSMHWVNNTIEWHADDGPLSKTVDNATARAWIQEAFDLWQSVAMRNAKGDVVATARLAVRPMGGIGKDVDASNYLTYISSDAGPTVIIFDVDGSIFDALGLDKSRIVGVSAPTVSQPEKQTIIKGFAIFNGSLLDDGKLSSDRSRAEALFKTTMLHELGHLLNLDHTSINKDIVGACAVNGDCQDGQHIATMSPELKTPLQGSPKRDDKITLSMIYPSEAFQRDFCTVTGAVFDAEGKPLRGINVLAKRVGDGEAVTRQDVRSMVSGVLYPGCSENSGYILHGLLPGKSYQVVYEPLPEQYRGSSGFEPLENPPAGFDSGTIFPEGSDAAVVSCKNGGETIRMKDAVVSAKNPCSKLLPVDNSSTPAATTAASGSGCSLILKAR